MPHGHSSSYDPVFVKYDILNVTYPSVIRKRSYRGFEIIDK